MHKDDCIWTEPNRCNCGWLQDIAKNPCEAVREIERLRAELAECKQDAERYRWLRDDCGGFEVTVREENEDGYESWVAGYPAEELDAAIDAARKGEGE